MEYRPVAAGDAEELAAWLAGEVWPFHAEPRVDPSAVVRRAAAGHYDGPGVVTCWVVEADRRVGLLRVWDLDDPTAMFDLRIAHAARGRGLGAGALTWLSGHVFDTRPGVGRIEATTRQDNLAMRAVLRRCGYAKEAHYRQGWPSADGTVHDAVGYALLRQDWMTGTVTPVHWHDEHPPPSIVRNVTFRQ